MRILHVHDFFAPGNSRYGFDAARFLTAAGHEVHVLAAVGPRGPEDGALVEGVRFHTYPYREELEGLARLRYALAANEERFGELQERHGFDLVLLNQPVCAQGVLRSPASEDVAKVYWFISPWAAEWRAEHPDSGAVARLFQEGFRHRLEDVAVRSSDRVLVESDFIRRELRRHHRKVPPEKIVLIPGAADLGRFRPLGTREEARARFGLGPGRIVLTVRRLVERMGIDLLVDAAAEIPEIELVIGGEGPLRTALEERAARKGVRARFLGYVSDEELPWLYRAADLFVLPTRALEGFGLVAVEAMACGTPAMGTPVGAIPEILGPLGLLFEEASPPALARGIRKFFAESDPALAERCRAYVAERHDWRTVAPALEKALLEIVHERARHGRP